jgi:hypothetical protein
MRRYSTFRRAGGVPFCLQSGWNCVKPLPANGSAHVLAKPHQGKSTVNVK